MKPTRDFDEMSNGISGIPSNQEAEAIQSDSRAIVNDVTRAWNELDADLIIRHLSENFGYDSQWVYDYMLYDEYVEYLRSKFQTIKNSNSVIKAETVEDCYFGGWMTKVIQYDGNIERLAYYRVRVEKNEIIKGDLCLF